MIVSFLVGAALTAYWALMDACVRRGNDVIDRRKAALLHLVTKHRELVVLFTAFSGAAQESFRRAAAEAERIGMLMRAKGLDLDA